MATGTSEEIIENAQMGFIDAWNRNRLSQSQTLRPQSTKSPTKLASRTTLLQITTLCWFFPLSVSGVKSTLDFSEQSKCNISPRCLERDNFEDLGSRSLTQTFSLKNKEEFWLAFLECTNGGMLGQKSSLFILSSRSPFPPAFIPSSTTHPFIHQSLCADLCIWALNFEMV